MRNLADLLDLPPTLLDAAGLEVPDAMQGRSLMPLLRRQTPDWRDEIFVQISESQVGRALRTRRWKYSARAEGLDGSGQPGAETYTEDCLYDLDADPYEMNNLAGLLSHRELADRLRERLTCHASPSQTLQV